MSTDDTPDPKLVEMAKHWLLSRGLDKHTRDCACVPSLVALLAAQHSSQHDSLSWDAEGWDELAAKQPTSAPKCYPASELATASHAERARRWLAARYPPEWR